MLFPTERTKQGQLRFPGTEVSALAPYRVCVHQIPNISTELSQSGASQLLSKRRKIDEPNPISCLATSAASPHSQGTRGQQCQSLLSLLPVGTKCRDFTSQPRNFVLFFLVTLLCPAHCPLGKVPAQLPVLLTQSLLCLLPHKYLQFKATVVPSTNRKGRSESSVPSAYGSRGSAPQAQPDTHRAEGRAGEVKERPQK